MQVKIVNSRWKGNGILRPSNPKSNALKKEGEKNYSGMSSTHTWTHTMSGTEMENKYIKDDQCKHAHFENFSRKFWNI